MKTFVRLASFGLGLFGVAALLKSAIKIQRAITFDGKVVLIMGGSRGLGLELARIFLKEGSTVVIAARDGQELERAKAILEEFGNATSLVCDVQNKEEIERTVSLVEEKFGRVDVLLNVAGIIEAGAFPVQTDQDFEESMRTHFWAPLHAVQAVLPGMKARRQGRIVNISSIAGLISVPHLIPYAASKHALAGLSEGLRTELVKDNIYVTTVCPGMMRTGSHLNADMKGNNQVEFALFSIFNALPFISIDSAEAARQIVAACAAGDAQLIISIQAKAAALAHALAPGLVSDCLALSNFFLPETGQAGTTKVKGKDSQSFASPSFLTTLSDRAAVRNNEIGEPQST
jgi:NAD(P)-dependent dehydrogenase (short-subunit alcohol dehydrogenase family)